MTTSTGFDYNRKISGELPFQQEGTQDVSLHQKFRALCYMPASATKDAGITEMQVLLDKLLHEGFTSGHESALLEVHKTLYMIYECHFMDPLSAPAQQLDTMWFMQAKLHIEQTWLQHEKAELAPRMPDAGTLADTDLLCKWMQEEANYETTLDALVVNFFKDKATLADYKDFIAIEANLNYRFFDALALTLLHYSEDVKEELCHHLWDESGEGVKEKSHTWQFSKALGYFGLEYPHTPVWEDWRPYAGYNLYFLFGLNRQHYYKAIGSLAMPELFDVNRDQYVVDGMVRLSLPAREDFSYYTSHIEGDEEHGPAWLDKVVTPIIKNSPANALEIAWGGAIRMKYMRLFNAFLQARFKIPA